jgi:hypothetical protein
MENANKVEAKEIQAQVVKTQIAIEKDQILQALGSSKKRFDNLRKTLNQLEKTITTINDDATLSKAYSVGQLSGNDYFYELGFYYDAVDDLLEMEKPSYQSWGKSIFD